MIPCRMNPLGLPMTYGKRLQYIASTGTQYINTGIAPDFANGDSVEISFFRADYTGTTPVIFGSRESGIRNGVYLQPFNLIVADENGYSSVDFTIMSVGDHTVKVGSVLTVDGTDYTIPRSVTCGLPLFIFALNNYGYGALVFFSGMRLYDWKYYRAGTLAQHLVPVLDRAGVPCLFDTVTRTLKYNAGTGAFDYA